jgi:proteic killer suppression protein
MDVEFADPMLDRLEVDAQFQAGHVDPVVRGFRKVMQAIRAATDERDLYASKGLRFEKLKGNRSHQRSLRINQQWRLIIEIEERQKKHCVRVIQIDDYH